MMMIMAVIYLLYTHIYTISLLLPKCPFGGVVDYESKVEIKTSRSNHNPDILLVPSPGWPSPPTPFLFFLFPAAKTSHWV